MIYYFRPTNAKASIVIFAVSCSYSHKLLNIRETNMWKTLAVILTFALGKIEKYY